MLYLETWLDFILGIVQAIAWPVVVLIVALAFKKPLSDLIPLIKKLKYKDLELDFHKEAEEVKQAYEQVKQGKPSGLAETSELPTPPEEGPSTSRSLILEGWISFEATIVSSAKILGYEHFKGGNILQPMGFLQDQKAMTKEQIMLAQRLRQIRNHAVHTENFNMAKSDAEKVAATLRGLGEDIASKAFEIQGGCGQ